MNGAVAIARLLISMLVVLLAVAGCRPETTQRQLAEFDSSRSNSLAAMQAAAREGQWAEAFERSDEVLLQHPEDADVMSEVARVAFFADKPKLAAELLSDAFVAEGFEHESRGLQAVVALIGVGKLNDGIELLERAIASRPSHVELRRWLFDFYIGTEDRLAAYPHGQYLLKHRNFDADLLVALASMPRQSLDRTPLDQMVERNPDDLRPWLGRAKNLFDQGKYQESIDLLDQILAQHLKSLTTTALKARVLAASSQFDSLVAFLKTVSVETRQYPDYWIAVGDLARSQEEHEMAIRAYWEATRRDPNVTEAWSKLANLLLSEDGASAIPANQIQAVYERSQNLNRLDRLVERFDQTGRDSAEQAVKIAMTLQGLGRTWEAEAWAALAMSWQVPASKQTRDAREAIVATMTRNTPWQSLKGQPAMQMDLSLLPMPTESFGDRGKNTNVVQANAEVAEIAKFDHGKLVLENEAAPRGVTFFGRTRSDPMDQNTMLHETLGCGGGVLDYDLDGWPDLYLTAAGGMPPLRDSAANALMRNQSGHFRETAPDASVGDTGFGQGIAAGDLNEDGFPDLLVLNFGLNRLYINNGDGTFHDASSLLGANSDVHWSTSGAIVDVNQDGLSDAIVLNYCHGDDLTTYRCGQDHGFSRSCTPVAYPADNDLFYQTLETGVLVDQTSRWQAVPAISGRALGVVAGAFDDQPGIDVYVVNDQTENHYWSLLESEDAVQLVETGITRGLASNDRSLAQGSMGIATGDFDLDQDTDFYVTNFHGEYSTYYEQKSAGRWKDSTSQKGLVAPSLSMVGFGSAAVDLNNNGLLELMVVNGGVDTYVFDDVKKKALIQSQPVQLFQLDPNGRYQLVEPSSDSGYMAQPHFGRALWTLDVDRDGRIDVGVTHQTEPVAILLNHCAQENHWIELQFVGVSDARDAVGTRVELRSGSIRRSSCLTSGDGYLSSNERIVRFGLGAENGPCEILVTWPDGTKQTIDRLTTDSRWLVVQREKAFQLK